MSRSYSYSSSAASSSSSASSSGWTSPSSASSSSKSSKGKKLCSAQKPESSGADGTNPRWNVPPPNDHILRRIEKVASDLRRDPILHLDRKRQIPKKRTIKKKKAKQYTNKNKDKNKAEQSAEWRDVDSSTASSSSPTSSGSRSPRPRDGWNADERIIHPQLLSRENKRDQGLQFKTRSGDDREEEKGVKELSSGMLHARAQSFIYRVNPRVDRYQKRLRAERDQELLRSKRQNAEMEKQVMGLRMLLSEMRDESKLKGEENSILKRNLERSKLELESFQLVTTELRKELAEVRREANEANEKLASRSEAEEVGREVEKSLRFEADEVEKGVERAAEMPPGLEPEVDGLDETERTREREIVELRGQVARLERSLELADGLTLHQELDAAQRRSLAYQHKMQGILTAQQHKIEELRQQVSGIYPLLYSCYYYYIFLISFPPN